MNRIWRLLIVSVLLGVPCATSAAGRQGVAAAAAQKNGNQVVLKPNERFDGMAALQTKKGKTRELHVVVRKWDIHGRQHIEKFPEQGFMVVNLLSGKVATVIDGKEEERKGGDFWTVPAGSTMSIQVTSESALVETIAVRKR